MFVFGVYTYLDLLPLLTLGMKNQSYQTTEIKLHAARSVPTVLILIILYWGYHILPTPKKPPNLSEYVSSVIGYGYKFSISIWLSMTFLPFMQIKMLGAKTGPVFLTNSYLGCYPGTVNLTQSEFMAQHNFWTEFDFWVSVGAIFIIIFVYLLLYIFVQWVTQYYQTVTQQEGLSKLPDTLKQKIQKFVYSVDKVLDPLQYIYSFPIGWWVAFTVIPGWSALVQNRGACGLLLSVIDFVSLLIIIIPTMIIAALSNVFFPYSQSSEPKQMQMQKQMKETWQLMIRNGFSFVIAVIWGMWITFALAPVMAYAMFNVDISWIIYPPVIGPNQVEAGVLFAFSVIVTIIILGVWLLYLKWYVGLQYMKDVMASKSVSSTLKDGLKLTFEFSLGFLWAWFVSVYIVNYLLIPLMSEAAGIQYAFYAPHSMLVNVIITVMAVIVSTVIVLGWKKRCNKETVNEGEANNEE